MTEVCQIAPPAAPPPRPIGASYPFAELPDAFAAFRAGTLGKIAVGPA